MNMINLASKHKYRKILVYVLLTFICIIIAILLFQGPSTLGDIPDDFVAYWSAGRLIAFQQNPYSLDNILSLNPELGFDVSVLVPMYYPPTVLPLFLPFGLFPFQLSRVIWLVLSIVVVFSSGFLIWRIYDGPNQKRGIVLLCILTFTPFYLSLVEGQITFLLLLGLAGYLFFNERGKMFFAGIFLTLLTIKFQLVYLIWIAIILWVIDQKQWMVVVGLTITSIVLVGSVSILHPSIIFDYIEFISINAPVHSVQCSFPSLGALFCRIGRGNSNWMRYIPSVAGIIWYVFFWFRNRANWSWRENISIVLIVSVMTAPLAWMHDQILFIIPIIEVIILMLVNGVKKKEKWIIVFYFCINIIAISLIPGNRINQIVFIWMPVLFLALYYLTKISYPSRISNPSQLDLNKSDIPVK